MSWRHNIKCCRFQRLFIRKATWIRCSWWKIYQMMIAHVIYTAIQHITPSGVLRHVESRLIAALGAYIRKADSLCTSIWSSDSICSDSSYRSIGSSKTYSADSLCTSTVSTDTFSGSSLRSIWSITSLEGDLDFDTQRDFVVSKEEQFDDSNNIFVSLIKLSHHIIHWIPIKKRANIFKQVIFSLKLNILLSYLWWNKNRKYNSHINMYFLTIHFNVARIKETFISSFFNWK